MAKLNLKPYMIAFLCFAGISANAQESATQEICIGDVENYSVTENSGSTYEWEVEESTFTGEITDNSASGNDIQIEWQNSPVGEYTLTVIETNSEGCPGAPVSATININPLPDAPEVTLTQPGCGDNNGSMEVNSPLDPDMQYSINEGADFQSSVNFEDLAPGVYEVIAQNASGCLSEPTEFEINEPLVIPETPVVEVTHPECGDTTGGLEITSPTGAEFEYSINGGDTFSSDLTYTDLAPGDYEVIATNGDCDSETVTVTIDPAPVVPENPEFNIVNPGCGEVEGTITVTSPVGGDYEYSANGGTWQDEPEFVLEAGTHQIQVRNTGSTCTSEVVDATIDEAPEIPTTSPIQFN